MRCELSKHDFKATILLGSVKVFCCVILQWEERLRRECSRLKSELDQLHSEEKHLAVESVKVQKEQEMRTAKQNWDRRLQESLKEVSSDSWSCLIIRIFRLMHRNLTFVTLIYCAYQTGGQQGTRSGQDILEKRKDLLHLRSSRS